MVASAQTQQDYVKALGRPNQKGVALSSVSIRVKGGHNAVLSKDKGFFSMIMSGRKRVSLKTSSDLQKQRLSPRNMRLT